MSKQETKAVEASTPEFIMTKAGFMVVGHELVGDKLAALMCEAVNSFDKSGLTAIVLRNDGYPQQEGKPVFGSCNPDTNSVSINIDRCWDRAVEISMKGKKNLSFLGVLWTNIIGTLGHELDHLVIANTDRELYEQMRALDGGKDLEDSAKEAERQLTITLARDVDCEIPAPADMGYLGLKWMALHTEDATKDLEWVAKARRMAEEGVVYHEEETDQKLTTYRQFVKLAYDQEDSPAWEQATNPISLTVYMDGQDEPVVLAAEPVEAPQVEVVEVEKVIEKAEAAVATAGANPGLFISAGIESDGDGDVVVMETAQAAPELQPENVVDDGLTLPMEPAVAAQQAVFTAAAAMPATPPAQSTYADNNMDPAIQPQVMELVWKTLYHHLFTKCGWSQNPQNGHYYFASGASILEHVNIQHIITQYGADNFIMEYDTLNAASQGPSAELCQGTIRGHFTKDNSGNLPTYTIYLNVGGNRHKRTLVPQNPEKMNAQNAYTNPALEAQQGHQIAWVFNGDMPYGTPFKEKCIAKITNNANGINYELIT